MKPFPDNPWIITDPTKGLEEQCVSKARRAVPNTAASWRGQKQFPFLWSVSAGMLIAPLRQVLTITSV